GTLQILSGFIVARIPPELEPHDRAARTRSFDTAECQGFEHPLPAEEGICGPLIGSCAGPASNGDCTFTAGKFDRCPHQRVGDALTAVPDPDEEARQQPGGFVLN